MVILKKTFLINETIFFICFFSSINVFAQDITSHFNFKKVHKTINFLTNHVPSLGYNLSFHYHSMLNSGHPNIDNQSEIVSLGSFSNFYSSRFSYYSKFLIFEIEPYLINHQNLSPSTKPSSTFDYSNHQLSGDLNKNNQIGIRQSRIGIHYKNVGLSYGKMSHWWVQVATQVSFSHLILKAKPHIQLEHLKILK